MFFFIQLKDFTQTEKNEATTEEVERVYDILKRTYREQESKYIISRLNVFMTKGQY